MAQFDDRRDAFENRFAHDEALRFKATARRNKLLGQWAAAQLGKTGAEAEEYAKAVVLADFKEAGDGDVIAKVRDDLGAAGHSTTDEAIRAKLDGFMTQAVAEMQTA